MSLRMKYIMCSSTALFRRKYRLSSFLRSTLRLKRLAMHFCNNAETKLKPKKYPELAQYTTCEADFALYDSEFDQLFDEFKQLLYSSVSMSQEEVYKLIADKYERFGYISRIDGSSHSIMQYPTYLS